MQLSQPSNTAARRENLAERIHARLKEDILSFRLLPGDRFSEGEIAARMNASRTPVRQALYQLEREGSGGAFSQWLAGQKLRLYPLRGAL